MSEAISPEVDKAEVARSLIEMTDEEEIKKVLSEHPDLKDELIKDENAFITKYSTPVESTESVKAPEEDDTPVEVKIPKKLLGTYKSVEDMRAGVDHKDTVIDFFKKQRVPELETENLTLKRRLEEFQTREKAAPVQPVQPFSPVNVDELGELGDLFDEGNQKKLIDFVKGLASRNRALETEVADTKNGVATVHSVVEKDLQDKQHEKNLLDEEAQIEAVRKDSPHIFGTNRPLSETKAEYLSFLANGARLLGYDGTIYKADGSFTDGARTAFGTYFDPTKGKDFQEKLAAFNVKFPEDYDALLKRDEIAKIRETFKVFDAKSGTHIPISWKKAAVLYADENGLTAKRELEARKAGAEAHERALGNRKNFAKEVSPKNGAAAEIVTDVNMIGGMVEDYFKGIQNTTLTGDRLAQKREELKVILLNGGMAADEVELYLKLPPQIV